MAKPTSRTLDLGVVFRAAAPGGGNEPRQQHGAQRKNHAYDDLDPGGWLDGESDERREKDHSDKGGGTHKAPHAPLDGLLFLRPLRRFAWVDFSQTSVLRRTASYHRPI